VILCEVLLSDVHSLAMRQMTAVLLRQYVDAHWTTVRTILLSGRIHSHGS